MIFSYHFLPISMLEEPNLIFLNKSPSNNPQSKSKAKLNNINTLSSRQRKKLIPCMIKNIAEVISCNSGLEFLPGRHHFRQIY